MVVVDVFLRFGISVGLTLVALFPLDGVSCYIDSMHYLGML